MFAKVCYHLFNATPKSRNNVTLPIFRGDADFGSPLIVCILFRSSSTGEVEGIQTSKNTLYGKKAIVVAAGCWSGSLMHDLLREEDIVLDVPVKPRKVEIHNLFYHVTSFFQANLSYCSSFVDDFVVWTST